MKVAVVGLKGGVAKTTGSVFLATALARRGRTLLVDSDPQGSALSWATTAQDDGDELPFSVVGLPVRDVHRKLVKLEGDYDHVVIDTPPGDMPIVASALKAVDVAVMPLQPTPMDLDRMMPTIELISEVEAINENLAFAVLLSRVRRISNEGRDARTAMEEMELPILQTEIPLISYYSDVFGEAITDVRDYGEVVDELLGVTAGTQASETRR